MTTEGNGIFKRAASNAMAAYNVLNPSIFLPLIKQKRKERPFCLIYLAGKHRIP